MPSPLEPSGIPESHVRIEQCGDPQYAYWLARVQAGADGRP